MWPYSYTPRGITRAQLLREENKEINLVPLEAYLLKAQTVLAIMGYTPAPSKLELGENVVIYDPQKSATAT